MASKTNLSTDTLTRLLNDETAEITVLFTRNGSTADDLTNRKFALAFCTKETMTPILTVADELLVRPTGMANPDRFTFTFSAGDHTTLDSTPYTLYLFELVGNKKKPLVYYGFQFLTKPDQFVAGSPRDAAWLQVDFTTATGTITSLPVYVLQGIPLVYAATRAAALAQPFVGRIVFVLVTFDELYNEVDVLYQRTQAKFKRLASFE